ncbi:MAG: hydroxylacyl-CoA dehydrogenase [Proteobacteria bacterium]|nr:hydroxylacyl-CoA dehydrogenase [Pseudomonadota bacterium]
MAHSIANKGTVAIIGAGVIGRSWAATFVAGGYTVKISDPNPEAGKRVFEDLPNSIAEIPQTSFSAADIKALMKHVTVTPDTDEAVKGAVAVQENGPEDVGFKSKLFAQLEAVADADALLISSSSGITPDKIGAKMKNPGRVLIGHPFNPPHMLPLVEICGGPNVDPALIEKAVTFYRDLGKAPAVLTRAVPGFVANRLQCVLVMEAIRIVESGVVDIRTLDQIVLNSLGPRWASVGPLLAGHFGGGPGGLAGIVEHILNKLAAGMGIAPVSDATIKTLGKLVNEAYPPEDMPRLAKMRDERTEAILDFRAHQTV